MAELFELVFALPEGDHDVFVLSDAVFEVNACRDAIVGTGNKDRLVVEMVGDSGGIEAFAMETARELIGRLPAGTRLIGVRHGIADPASP